MLEPPKPVFVADLLPELLDHLLRLLENLDPEDGPSQRSVRGGPSKTSPFICLVSKSEISPGGVTGILLAAPFLVGKGLSRSSINGMRSGFESPGESVSLFC